MKKIILLIFIFKSIFFYTKNILACNKCDNLNNLAIKYMNTSLDSTIFFSKKMIELSDSLNCDNCKIRGNLLYARALSNQGKYNDAGQYANVAYKLSLKDDDKKNLADCFKQLGEINRGARKFSMSLEFLYDALQIYEDKIDTLDVAICLNRIAAVNYEICDFKNSIKFADSALIWFEILINIKWKANTLNILGASFTESKKFDDALNCFKKALEIYEQEKDYLNIPNIINNISNLYFDKNDYKNAKYFAYKSLDISIKNKSFPYIRVAYALISKINFVIKNFELAYNYLDSFNQISDTLYGNNLDLDKIYSIYIENKKTQEKQKIIDHQLSDNKHKARVISYIIVSSFLIFLFLGIILILLKNKNISYKLIVKQLNEKLEMEDNLFQKERLLLEEELKEKRLEAQAVKTKIEIQLDEVQLDEIILIKENIDVFQEDKIDENFLELKEKIDFLINVKKIFINKDLTLNLLANELKINRNILSKYINITHNQNFNSYINSFRIKEAQRLINSKEYQNLTLEAISNLVGFNNKVTFNAAFKQITGITPSIFKKNI